MKVLIWLGCLFVYSAVMTLGRMAGFLWGGVPTAILFGLTIWIAVTLCKKWDERCLRNRAKKQDAPPIDVACASVYPTVFDECEANRCMVSELKKVLRRFRREGKIDAVQEALLLEEYSRPGYYTPPSERKPRPAQETELPQPTSPAPQGTSPAPQPPSPAPQPPSPAPQRTSSPRFCWFCGAPVTAEDARFCNKCGKELIRGESR